MGRQRLLGNLQELSSEEWMESNGVGRLEVQLGGGVLPCAREEKLEQLSGRRCGDG